MNKEEASHYTFNGAFVSHPPFTRNYADSFLLFEKGKGVWLWDHLGKKYLDFGSGIAVNSFGHGRADFAKIVARQMKTLAHTSNLFTTEPTLGLARRLTGSSPLPADQPYKDASPSHYFAGVHLGNSGSEANETALKYARIHAKRKAKPNGFKVLAFKNSFHGRTMGALSATWTEKYRTPSEPLVPGFEFIEFNDVDTLRKVLTSDFCAVIVEPVQGEGGLNPVTPAFAAALNERCRTLDITLIADEVQCGMGRTGTFFASEQLGLEPDIITLAKPLAGGLPASATLVRKAVADSIHPGDHGGTFGGNPVACALGCHIFDFVNTPAFLNNVRELSRHFRDGLTELKTRYPFLGNLKGLGMLVGLEINEPGTLGPGSSDTIARLLDVARDNGLIVLRSGTNILRLAPPLTMNTREAEKGLVLLDKVFTAFAKAGKQ